MKKVQAGGLVCLLTASMMFGTGCATTMQEGRRIGSSRVQQIKKDEMTKQELLALLGTPSKTDLDTSGGEKVFYSFVKQEKKLPGMIFVPFVQFFFLYSWVTEETQNLTVVLKNDVVRNYSYTKTKPTKRKVGMLDYFFQPQ